MSDQYEGDQGGEPEEPWAPAFPTEPTAPTSGPPTGAYPVSGPAPPFGGSAGLGGGGYPPPPPGTVGPGSWHSGWAEPNWAPPRSSDPRNRNSAAKTVLLLAVAILLIVAGVGVGHGLWRQASGPAASSQPFGGSSRGTLPPSSTTPGSGAPSDVSAIASKVDPGLVDINTTLSYQGEQAAGTGMVLTSSGEVLTNNHVIDGATSISVTDVGNGQTYSATVVGYDISRDLAVLQLHGASGLQTVSIGNSSSVSVGESVVGIGNAGGTGGTPSAVGGSVTALNQTITASDDGDGTTEQLTGLIESNADIQPGDSGGPLVDTNGQVLGIDTAASAGYSFQSGGGNGYSIPINGAIATAKEIEAGQGSTTIHIGLTAFLGVLVSPTSSSGGFGGGFGGGGSQQTGVTVAGVVTGDPANEAGIATGDVITALGGTNVGSPTALTAALVPHHPGDKVQITWTDTSGQSHTATVQLASGPPA